MSRILSLFNHKGGVSKTTTSFNLGWALADLGKRVLIVDGDPQCNLTGMVLGFDGQDDFEEFYQEEPDSNLCAALRPAFTGAPEKLAPPTLRSTKHKSMWLLAGHIDLSDYEAQLAVAFTTVTSLPALRNLPGAVGHLLRTTAEKNKIDIVIVDMSPSVGALNQSLLLCSDYFLVPTSPDYFCYLAVNSLAKVLPRWNFAAAQLRGHDAGLAYPLSDAPPQFLGIVSQRYRPRSGAPAAAFQKWIDRIKKAVEETLVPSLSKQKMAISKQEFMAAKPKDTPYNLCNIADFNSLIAKSQGLRTPVFALTDAQINEVGVVLDQMRGNRDEFQRTFKHLATTISHLTGV